MSEKLFTLCHLQLGSIVSDLEKSVEGVNRAATRLMREVASNDEPAMATREREERPALGRELKEIIVGLQFHDELTQRLNHVQALLKLLQDQTDQEREKEVDSETLMSMLTAIFSSNAEFKQLDKVFPGCGISTHTDAIELF